MNTNRFKITGSALATADIEGDSAAAVVEKVAPEAMISRRDLTERLEEMEVGGDTEITPRNTAEFARIVIQRLA